MGTSPTKVPQSVFGLGSVRREGPRRHRHVLPSCVLSNGSRRRGSGPTHPEWREVGVRGLPGVDRRGPYGSRFVTGATPHPVPPTGPFTGLSGRGLAGREDQEERLDEGPSEFVIEEQVGKMGAPEGGPGPSRHSQNPPPLRLQTLPNPPPLRLQTLPKRPLPSDQDHRRGTTLSVRRPSLVYRGFPGTVATSPWLPPSLRGYPNTR